MIKWFFRWLFRLLILLVVLAVAALLLLDTIAREITEYRIHQKTGLEVKIGHMRVGLLEPRLTIENLVIYNTAEFGGSPLLDAPELHVECDRNPFFHPGYRFKLVRINLARLNIVEDAQGRRNLDVFGKRLQKSDVLPLLPLLTLASKDKTARTNGFPRIDTLNLSLGRATYLSMKNPGKVNELTLDVRNQVYTDVKSSAQMQTILLVILLNHQNILGADGQYWLDILGLQNKK
jgi:hypothetical protein